MLDSLLYLLTAFTLYSFFITHLVVVQTRKYNQHGQPNFVYTVHFIPPDFQFVYELLRAFKVTATIADPHHPPPPPYRNRTRGRRSGTTN